MLTALGKPATPADAVDLLLECHGRIRTFLALALRLGGARRAGAAELAEVAGQVHRYFAEALPLHAEDEERSLAPRLHGREPALDAALLAMTREHQEHQRPLGELLGACLALSRDPGRHGELAPVLLRAGGDLQRHFAGHLGREEEIIFPAVRRLLDGAADGSLVEEIRLRRTGTSGQPYP